MIYLGIVNIEGRYYQFKTDENREIIYYHMKPWKHFVNVEWNKLDIKQPFHNVIYNRYKRIMYEQTISRT